MIKTKVGISKRILILLSLLTVFGYFFEKTHLSQHIEELTVDVRYRYFNQNLTPSNEIILIDIDEQSLKYLEPKFGRWPWPRSIYKETIEFISKGNPKAILFDIIFSGNDRNLNSDKSFALATEGSQVTSHAIQFLKESSVEDTVHLPLPESLLEKIPIYGTATGLNPHSELSFHDFALPYPELLASSHHFHTVNTVSQSDGIIRRMPLLIQYDQNWIPSLAFKALTLGKSELKFEFKDHHLYVFSQNNRLFKIPVNSDGTYSIHFYPSSNRPRMFRFAEVIDSASMVLNGETENLSVPPDTFQDKIILIGASATGLADLKTTPLAENEPGVLLHTSVISNILKNHFLTKVLDQRGFAIGALLALLVYFSLFATQSLAFRNIAPMAVVLSYFILAILVFRYFGLGMPMFIPLSMSLLAIIDGFVFVSFIEGKAKRRLTNTLSKYLSPEITKNLVNNGIDPSAEVGHIEELSLIFSDIRGFTTLSETMDPKIVVTILNEYLAKMTEIVFQHRGTLDKFIGDAVMAFWGAPIRDTKHAELAVAAAIRMIQILKVLNTDWKKRHLPELEIGIGINTGNMIVGNIGSDKRLDYTVIGDAVNLTSRLESLSKVYQVSIVVGHNTYKKTSHLYVFRMLDLVQVKGKTETIFIWEPISLRNEITPEDLKFVTLFNESFKSYKEGRFHEALETFKNSLSLKPNDGPSILYIDRCKNLIENPPKEWDGVFSAHSK